MAGLRTEFPFTLPKGYVDAAGALHRDGVMRLATARDEIEPLRDRSIEGPDDPYLTILVLSRVLTRLGTLDAVGSDVVEGLFAADLAFLQDLYGIINFGDQRDVAALQATVPTDEPDDEPADDEAAVTPADTDEFGTVVLPDVEELQAGNGGPRSSGGRRRTQIEEVRPGAG